MTYQVTAYDNTLGEPVAILVTTGHHDVSRMVNTLSGMPAVIEQLQAGQKLLKQLRRHNQGRTALALLKTHGGPDLTTEDAAAALLAGTNVTMCGNGRLSIGPAAQATVYRWICPWCQSPDAPFGDGERCLHCHGQKVTNDVSGWDEAELTPAPRPPAVMRNPCVDCAYRPGSPEQDSGIAPGPETPFYCHHGLIRDGDGYITTATVGTLPLGAMVCAGWWALANGKPLPAKDFHDPGGADRRQDAPPEQSSR